MIQGCYRHGRPFLAGRRCRNEGIEILKTCHLGSSMQQAKHCRHKEQGGKGRDDQATDHRTAQRGVLLATFGVAQRHRNDAEDHRQGVLNYRRIQDMRWRGCRRRAYHGFAEVNGNCLRRSEDICECGTHVKLIVRRNGKDLSGPLCPKIIAIRRWRMDIAEAREPDAKLMEKLLDKAKL